jgi:hypothetical protein
MCSFPQQLRLEVWRTITVVIVAAFAFTAVTKFVVTKVKVKITLWVRQDKVVCQQAVYIFFTA